MQSICHCSAEATSTVEDVPVCQKCEDFLARHPALKPTLIPQWRTAAEAATAAEPATETES